MRLSNVFKGPVLFLYKVTYLSEGDQHGNINWRNAFFTRGLLTAIFVSEFWLTDEY